MLYNKTINHYPLKENILTLHKILMKLLKHKVFLSYSMCCVSLLCFKGLLVVFSIICAIILPFVIFFNCISSLRVPSYTVVLIVTQHLTDLPHSKAIQLYALLLIFNFTKCIHCLYTLSVVVSHWSQ